MTDVERLDYWMKMQSLNPKGFRSAPSSRKNPKFHSAKPTTMIEKLAFKVYGKKSIINQGN